MFVWRGHWISSCKDWFLCFAFLLSALSSCAVQEIDVDVCVYGGTSGGVIAAVQAARLGKSVALVCDKNHLGGMTSSGLGWTDVGHVGTGYIQGMANEFYTRINQKYGYNVNYDFEPHVAEAVFDDMVQQADVLVYTNEYLASVVKQGTQITAVIMNDGTVFRAKMFIDCSYTGDLMAAAGVSYTIGRESINQYGESLAGIRPPDTSFGASVNPYVISNSPASGLLPLIQTNTLGTLGSADSLVQTYNFRMCFTQVASNRLAITAPPNYNASEYELLARYLQANPSLTLGSLMTLNTPLPNSKMDINNSGPLSTDLVGDSSGYTLATPASRGQIWSEHQNYEQGFFYFLATDPRVPSAIQSAMQSWGPCKDEFIDNGGWPWELYVRESRRMVSSYVMTQSNVFNLLPVPDSIGMAGYFTDSHYCERILTNNIVVNEGTSRGDITIPYPIAYRALTPNSNECVNLLVPWALSASHVAFCSLRMEPAFMIMGQAAGTAACMAIDDGVAVQNVSLPKLQAQLVANQQVLNSTSTNGITVGDTDTTGVNIVGTWLSSTSVTGYYGTNYLDDGNTDKGLSSVTFTPTLPQAGTYQVYTIWTANANRATNVPIDIVYPNGTNTVLVNQTAQGSQWVLLITTNFNAGTSGYVRIRNAGTTGYVIANAVEFVSQLPIVSLWATDAKAARFGLQPGSFTISRTGATNTALTVNLSISGTAVSGVDYQPIATTINLPAGVTSTNILITPHAGATPVGNKTVIINVVASAVYSTGTLAGATITISDTSINSWRLQYFGIKAFNPGVAGDDADPANDGVPNVIKYALGLNPTNAIIGPPYYSGIDTNGYFAISYKRPDPPPPDITYGVSASNDLVSWCSNNACVFTRSIAVNTNSTATVTVEGNTPVQSPGKEFLRLNILDNSGTTP